MTIHKTLLKIFIVASLVVTSAYSINVKKTEAFGVPVMDLITETMTGKTSIETMLSELKEYIVDAALYAAQQAILQVIETNITSKIISSTSALVQNLEYELLSLQQDIANQLSNEFISISTCNFFPGFKSLLQNTTQNMTRQNYQNKFKLRITCSLTGITISTYLSGNFKAGGGWNTWKQMLKNPDANTPIGVFLASQEELSKRKRAGEKQQLAKFEWGNGIKELKDAVTGLVKMPGKLVGDMVTQTFGSKFRRRENVDELTELLGSLIGSYVSNYLNGVF